MDRPKRVITFIAIAIYVVINLTPASTALPADNPSIGEILITSSSDRLIFFSYLRDGFTGSIKEKLQSGLPINFTFYVELRRKRLLWINSRLARKILSHHIKYDALKEEYVYILNVGSHREELITKDYEEVQRRIIFLDGVELIGYDQLKEGKTYYVRIKAEIKPVTPPSPLQYLKVFFPFLDKDTSWQESKFFVIKKTNSTVSIETAPKKTLNSLIRKTEKRE